MRHRPRIVLFLGILIGLGIFIAPAAADGPLRVATFRVDVTPPAGYLIHWHKPLVTVETPLLAKGIVLDDGAKRCVVCALDWCLLSNSGYRQFRKNIATAVGTDPSHVAVQCVHAHTAPRLEPDVQKILVEAGVPYRYFEPEWFEAVNAKMAAAVKAAVERLKPVDSVGIGGAKVERVASSRRIITPDGKFHGRMSGTTNPKLQALPEGRIDPVLSTITLARDGKPQARLHYYATHPQTFYGDGRASYDMPGFARERLEEEEGVFQIYFTGCAGDIAMGKYNDRSREARGELTKRLLRGMEDAVAATEFTPVDRFEWRTVPITLPPRSDEGHTVADYWKKLKSPNLKRLGWLRPARQLAYAGRSTVPIDLTCLEIGPARILHLPGEPFVEYQLFAKQTLPDAFVAVAALGDWSPGYICTEQAFSEGGYEPGASNVAPESEKPLKAAIRRVLGE